MQSINKSANSLNDPAHFKSYYKRDSLTENAMNEIQRINSAKVYTRDTTTPSLPTTPTTTTSTRSSLNTSPTTLLTTTLAKSLSQYASSNRNSMAVEPTANRRHIYETDLDYSPPTNDKQHSKMIQSSSNNKLNLSTNFDWTKLVQTATKAFESNFVCSACGCAKIRI